MHRAWCTVSAELLGGTGQLGVHCLFSHFVCEHPILFTAQSPVLSTGPGTWQVLKNLLN